MKKKYSYLLLLSIAAASCKNASITEVKPFDSNFADSTKVLLVADQYPIMDLKTDGATNLHIPEGTGSKETDLQTNIRYIPLETKDECLVGNIDKLASDGTSLFILDETNKAVFRFSQQDGSFLNRIGNIGRGPGEYTGVTDMCINKKKKEVCLLDYYGFKLLYFDYEGTLLREEPLYYFYTKMEFVGDHMIMHTYLNGNSRVPAVNNNSLVMAGQDQTPLAVGFPYPEHLEERFRQGNHTPFIVSDGEVYYNHILSDTIWQIKEEGVCEAKYVFKFPGRDNLFSENEIRTITDEKYQEKTKDAVYYRDAVCMTKDFLYTEIANGMTFLHCIPTGNSLYGKPYYKYFGKRSYTAPSFSLNGTSFVHVLQPFELMKEIQGIKNMFGEQSYQAYLQLQLTEEERLLLAGMTEEDNPVLMVMDIEPF